MPPKQFFNIGGINTYINPSMPEQDGALIHSVNMVSFPYGAKTKRTGYSTFLGTPDASTVNSLLDYHQNDGSTFYLYRASGSALYYSLQGTGAWTLSGNGTISNGAHFGGAILDNTFIGGDGVGSTRHTTSGTSFTNTTLAPISEFFEQYQNRIYASGTAGDCFYSTTNDATNWNTSGTSDSSSFKVPGAGKNSRIFKTSDRLIIPKNSGFMFKWDGYNLIDMTTEYGPSSPYSLGKVEDYRFFINKYGHYGFGGSKAQLLSNAIQRQFYNNDGSGILGTAFSTLPAECHIYDYLSSVGTVTDDFTSRVMTNTIIKYDFQKNEYLNWDFANKPTSFLSFKNNSSVQTLIFGDASGQVYQLDNTTSDNGSTIDAEMVFVFNFGLPEFQKKWDYYRGIFNPGCEAKVQVACSDTYTYKTLRWIDLGDVSDGAVEYRFPPGSESRFLFVRIYESSKNARFTYYGCSISASPNVHT